MKRREFITLLGVAALLAPVAAGAQESGRIYRLGLLHPSPRQSPQLNALFDELRRLGFTEGQNLIVDARGLAARTEQFPALAIEMAKAGVDAIVCGGPLAANAAQDATHTIPLFAVIDDMVAAGLVPTLARPGGNITGVSIFAAELDGKRQEILMELVPNIHRMAALADSSSTGTPKLQALQEAARVRGVQLSVHLVNGSEQIVPAIDEAKRMGAGALNVLASAVLYARRYDIYERATALRLPAIYQWAESAEESGLVAYGPRITQLYRQLARQVVKVLRGTKPPDVPVEQPTKFELVINLKTAKALGLDVPPTLLALADEVID
jgi:putative ABC transport system substrate-binding protein